MARIEPTALHICFAVFAPQTSMNSHWFGSLPFGAEHVALPPMLASVLMGGNHRGKLVICVSYHSACLWIGTEHSLVDPLWGGGVSDYFSRIYSILQREKEQNIAVRVFARANFGSE